MRDQTALMLAYRYLHEDIVNLLLQAGVQQGDMPETSERIYSPESRDPDPGTPNPLDFLAGRYQSMTPALQAEYGAYVLMMDSMS